MTSKQTIERAARFLRESRSGFSGHGEIIEAVAMLVALRVSLLEPESEAWFRKASAVEKRATARFHQRLDTAEASLPIVRLFQEYKLDALERETLLFLAAAAMGIVPPAADMQGFQFVMRREGAEQLKVAHALSDEGRLARAGLIDVSDPDDLFGGGMVTVDQSVVSRFLEHNAEEAEGWEVQSQEQFFERCRQLFAKLRERSAMLDGAAPPFRRYRSGVEAVNRKINRMTRMLLATLDQHPNWPLSALRGKLSQPEIQVIIILSGKDLGWCDIDDEIFVGEGIARALSADPSQLRDNLAVLKRDRILRKEDYIRICGGYGDSQAFDDEGTLRTCEFELTDDFSRSLTLQRSARRVRTRHRICTPTIKLDQLVLADDVTSKLKMIIAQATHNHTMMNTWGLGEIIPYGRAVTVLFAGAPGVGKTASAEALAYELGKPLLTVNYAQTESCWVGETEKNIARIFREAAEAHAVLFWDEADAMIYARDPSNRTWENRQVNVLLQLLERFDGVCIMATNHKMALDRALERRVAIKVEFEPPDAELRYRIWCKLLPPRMPVAPDLDLKRLAQSELTGGEIKNAVLNAARMAVERGEQGPVTMADFERAIEMELKGRWNREGLRPIGFRRIAGADHRLAAADDPAREAATSRPKPAKLHL